MQPDEKACPYCAETIKAAALKCRFCGSDLSSSTAAPPAAKASSSPVWVTCGACLAKNPDDQAFCSRCGRSLPRSSGTAALRAAAPPTAPTPPKEGASQTLLRALLMIGLFLLAGLLFGIGPARNCFK